MVSYLETLKSAEKSFNNADHMIFITYSLLNDVHLFPSIITHLYNGFFNCMITLILYDQRTRIQFQNKTNFNSELYLFESKIIRKYKIEPKFIRALKELREFQQAIEQSETNFSRPNRFVLCSKDYNLKTIDMNLIKKFNQIGKEYLYETKKIVTKK